MYINILNCFIDSVVIIKIRTLIKNGFLRNYGILLLLLVFIIVYCLVNFYIYY